MDGIETSNQQDLVQQLHHKLRDRNPVYRFRMYHDLSYKDVGDIYSNLYGVGLSGPQQQNLEGLDSQRTFSSNDRPSRGPRFGSAKAFATAVYKGAVPKEESKQNLSFNEQDLLMDYFGWWTCREGLLSALHLSLVKEQAELNPYLVQETADKLRVFEDRTGYGLNVDDMFDNEFWRLQKHHRLADTQQWREKNDRTKDD